MHLLDCETVSVNSGWFTFSVHNGEGGAFVWAELEAKY